MALTDTPSLVPSNMPQARTPTAGPGAPDEVTINILLPNHPALGLNLQNLPVTSTIGDLRQMIHDRLDVHPPPSTQRLFYLGRDLTRDADTLLDVVGTDRIRESLRQTIHLVFRNLDSSPPRQEPPVPAVNDAPVPPPETSPGSLTPGALPGQQGHHGGPRSTSAYGYRLDPSRIRDELEDNVHHLDQPRMRSAPPPGHIEDGDQSTRAGEPLAAPQGHSAPVPMARNASAENAAPMVQAPHHHGAAYTPHYPYAQPYYHPHPFHSPPYYSYTYYNNHPHAQAFWPPGVPPAHSQAAQFHAHNAPQPAFAQTQAQDAAAAAETFLASFRTPSFPSASGGHPPFGQPPYQPSRPEISDFGNDGRGSHPRQYVRLPIINITMPYRTRWSGPQAVYILYSPYGSHSVLVPPPNFVPRTSSQEPHPPSGHVQSTAVYPPQPSQQQTQHQPAQHQHHPQAGHHQNPQAYAAALRRRTFNYPYANPAPRPQPANPHVHARRAAAAAVPILAQIWMHLWLLIRLAAFIWFLTSANASWSRISLMCSIAVIIFLVNAGALNRPIDHVVGHFRRHLDNMMPVPEIRHAVAAAPDVQNDAEPDPADAAVRIVAQRRRGNALMLAARRIERASLLFVASIAPGVAERHIAHITAEVRAELRRRRAQAAAAAAEAAADAAAPAADGGAPDVGTGAGATTPGAQGDQPGDAAPGEGDNPGNGAPVRPARGQRRRPQPEPVVAM